MKASSNNMINALEQTRAALDWSREEGTKIKDRICGQCNAAIFPIPGLTQQCCVCSRRFCLSHQLNNSGMPGERKGIGRKKTGLVCDACYGDLDDDIRSEEESCTLIKHSKSKRRGGQLATDSLLGEEGEEEGEDIRSSLQYHYKEPSSWDEQQEEAEGIGAEESIQDLQNKITPQFIKQQALNTVGAAKQTAYFLNKVLVSRLYR